MYDATGENVCFERRADAYPFIENTVFISSDVEFLP